MHPVIEIFGEMLIVGLACFVMLLATIAIGLYLLKVIARLDGELDKFLEQAIKNYDQKQNPHR